MTWGSGRGSGVQTKLSRLELVVGSRRPSCCFDCSTLRDVKVKCMIMIHDIVNVEDAFEDRIDTKVILSRPGVDRDGLDGGHGGDPDCFALFRATLKHWHIWLFRSGKPEKGHILVASERLGYLNVKILSVVSGIGQASGAKAVNPFCLKLFHALQAALAL